jgi:hypothetical protein
MTNYARMRRLGITPWERYGQATAASIAARLDREEADRSRPLGWPMSKTTPQWYRLRCTRDARMA